MDEEGGGDVGGLMSRARTIERRASKDSYLFMSRDSPMETLVALRTSKRVTSFGFTLERDLRTREGGRRGEKRRERKSLDGGSKLINNSTFQTDRCGRTGGYIE